MPRTATNPPRPVTGYFAYWIDRLRLADNLPAALAGCSTRRPTPATASTARTSSAGCVSAQPPQATGILAPGCAPKRSATRTNRRFNRASPKFAPPNSATAQLAAAVSIIRSPRAS